MSNKGLAGMFEGLFLFLYAWGRDRGETGAFCCSFGSKVDDGLEHGGVCLALWGGRVFLGLGDDVYSH